MSKKPRGGSQGLGGLADAFVKAGLASAELAEQAKNERRRENKTLGAEGLERRREERESAYRGQTMAREEAALASQKEQAEAATVERAQRLVREFRDTSRGNKRWFFVARDGRIPYVDVSDAVMRKLSDGQAGIVETLGAVEAKHAVVTDPQALAVVAAVDAEAVRFWNRSATGK